MPRDFRPILTGVREQGKGKSSVSVSADRSWKGREMLGCTVKKGYRCSFPSLAGKSLTKLSLDGNRESLVSDFLAGDGKIGNLFTVWKLLEWRHWFSREIHIEAKPGSKPHILFHTFRHFCLLTICFVIRYSYYSRYITSLLDIRICSMGQDSSWNLSWRGGGGGSLEDDWSVLEIPLDLYTISM